jgi:hypothetical protein
VTQKAISLSGTGGTHEIVNYGLMTANQQLIGNFNPSGPINVHFTNAGTAISNWSIIFDILRLPQNPKFFMFYDPEVVGDLVPEGFPLVRDGFAKEL